MGTVQCTGCREGGILCTEWHMTMTKTGFSCESEALSLNKAICATGHVIRTAWPRGHVFHAVPVNWITVTMSTCVALSGPVHSLTFCPLYVKSKVIYTEDMSEHNLEVLLSLQLSTEESIMCPLTKDAHLSSETIFSSYLDEFLQNLFSLFRSDQYSLATGFSVLSSCLVKC